MQLSIGIDWADQSHAVCLREQATRRILAEFVIDHDAQGLAQFERMIASLNCIPDNCVVAIETKAGLLVNYLLQSGYHVHAIPTLAVKAYRNRQRRSGAKSDGDDARLLSDILCQDLSLFPELLRDTPLALQLREVYRAREELVRNRTHLINQLKQSLKSCYPVALKLFARIDSAIFRAFIHQYPTQTAAQSASVSELEAFFKVHHYKRTDKLPQILKKLQAPAIPVPAWQAEAGRFLTSALLAQLATVSDHIDQFETHLTSLLAQHPDAPLFLSLPRVSAILAAGFISELGDCRSKYPSASVLQAFAGTAPVTKQSGSGKQIRFRYACNKPLRNLIQQFARQSALPGGSSWARGYLSNQIERGHHPSRAYRALANRWINIIFRLWQDRSLYDEHYHLQRIARRGLAYPTKLLEKVA